MRRWFPNNGHPSAIPVSHVQGHDLHARLSHRTNTGCSTVNEDFKRIQTDPSGTTSYTYDIHDRLQNQSHPSGRQITYSYSAVAPAQPRQQTLLNTSIT